MNFRERMLLAVIVIVFNLSDVGHSSILDPASTKIGAAFKKSDGAFVTFDEINRWMWVFFVHK